MSRSEELEYMFSGNGYQPPTEDCFNTEKKVCFHTGLPSTEIRLTVFDHISTSITQHSQTLSKFQEFIMVLIKLRLNIPSPSISTNSIQDIFLMVDCNRFLFVVTHLLARQKSAMETNANVFPLSIWQKSDCDHRLLWSFYWSTNKPSSTSTNFFPSHKHHNTIKVLIGITPQGTISYISQAQEGRTSDKYLNENCGLLVKLMPGDIVGGVHDSRKCWPEAS